MSRNDYFNDERGGRRDDGPGNDDRSAHRGGNDSRGGGDRGGGGGGGGGGVWGRWQAPPPRRPPPWDGPHPGAAGAASYPSSSSSGARGGSGWDDSCRRRSAPYHHGGGVGGGGWGGNRSGGWTGDARGGDRREGATDHRRDSGGVGAFAAKDQRHRQPKREGDDRSGVGNNPRGAAPVPAPNVSSSMIITSQEMERQKERYQELMDLVQNRKFQARSAIFDSLSWDDKLLVQGYPPIPRNFNNPLPEDMPPEATAKLPEGFWEEKRAAARHAVEEVNKKFAAPNDDDSDDDDDDSSSDVSCDGSPYCECRDCRRSKRSKCLPRYEDVLLALPNCLLFDAAFRIRWPRKSDVSLCWCPCGAYMKPWQDFFGLTGTEEMNDAAAKCGGDGKKKKEPHALLAHLRKQGETCPVHYGVAMYLEALYRNWNGPGLAHKDIYKNRDHKKYQEAESAENRQNRRMFAEMQDALLASEERERAMQKEVEESKKKMESLDKVNREYKLKVEETKEILHKLGLETEEKEAELTDSDLESYRLIFKNFVEATKAKAKKPKTPIEFDVPNNFSLQELFDDFDALGKKDKSFLLRDLDYNNDLHFHAPKLVHDWEISFGALGTIDQGGPTKAFLDQVWQQMPALKVKVGDVEVKLFDFDEKKSRVVKEILPASDAEIRLDGKSRLSSDAKKEIRDKAHRYYRAIGRIMFHSLMRDVVPQISSTAMPAFYRNVIFRECNLQDRRYKHNKIIRDLQATGGNIAEQYNDMIDHPLSFYGIETDIPDEKITKENFISKVVHHTYIKERSIFLEALQEGLFLGGYADFSPVLRIMPGTAVSKLLFAPVNIKPQEVIQILHPVYGSIEEDREGQKHLFENVLTAILREKGEEDNEFLRSFVSFVTGLTFVPCRKVFPDYRITVEFDITLDAPKAFPWAKTCDNLLWLPHHAYNGDRELFEELLNECFLVMKENNFSDEY